MGRAPGHFGLLQRVDGKPPRDEVDDVIHHLGYLLNTKRGYGSFLPDIGLDIGDAMWSARPMSALASHIRDQIERFEPRLLDVKLEPEMSDDTYCPVFRIYGRVGDSRIRILLTLHTVYCSVHVERE